jgi:hypothetical protein
MRNCSFCNLPGHDIRTCNDVSIQENIQEVEHTISHLNTEDEIERYLKSRSLKLLRVMCVPFGMKMTLQKKFYINLLKRYYALHTNIQVETNVTIESSEAEIKEFSCNYIKHYLTFMVEQELPIYSVIRFIENINSDLWTCYRPEFSQSYNVFVGIIWMRTLFIMMDQSITTKIMNNVVIFNVISRLTMPFLEFEPELEPEWKMDIHPMMLCTEQYHELQTKEECPICLNDNIKHDILITNCNHSFCKDCVFKSISMCKNARKQLSCALCRGIVTVLETNNVEEYNNLCIILD